MIIRKVTEKDFDSWLKMRYDLWPYHTMEELETEMRKIYKFFDVDNIAYVAEEGNIIVGLIELSIHETAPGCTTKNVGFIEGWYVKEDMRQKGIGKLLVKQGEIWAKAAACMEMASDTNERYPISPIAHKALGYQEVNIPLHYRKSLMNI